MNIQIIKNKSKKLKSRRGYENKKNKDIIIIFLCLAFMIGLLIGVFYFKNIKNSNYFEENPNILENLDLKNIENNNLFVESLLKNIIMLIFIWIIGLSILGAPILIAFILYDGFSLGITLSYILNTFGLYKGYFYLFSTMYLVSIINIAVMILLCNSAIRATINILIQKTNIKSEFVRHSLVCIIMLIVLMFSSILEVYLMYLIK